MAKVEDVKDIVAEDISKVLAREEKLESLSTKFVDMSQDGFQFQRGAKTVKNNSCNIQ